MQLILATHVTHVLQRLSKSVRILATHVLQAAKLNFADIAQAVFGLLALLSILH